MKGLSHGLIRSVLSSLVVLVARNPQDATAVGKGTSRTDRVCAKPFIFVLHAFFIFFYLAFHFLSSLRVLVATFINLGPSLVFAHSSQ
jgi:hypothetical protein